MTSRQLRIRWVLWLVILAGSGLFTGCLDLGPCAYEELKRIKSPDSTIEAVLFTTNCGATTSLVYSVSLVWAGAKFNKDDPSFKAPLFTADHLSKLQLTWKDPKLFEISYEQARIHHFSNSWSSPDKGYVLRVVELKLKPTSEASSLSERDREEIQLRP